MKTYLISIFLLIGILLSSCGGAPTTEPPAQPVRDVVILVVDDFILPKGEISRSYDVDNQNGQNCIVKPNGQTYASTGAISGGDIPTASDGVTEISHGDSVYNDILAQNNGFVNLSIDPTANPTWMKRVSILITEQSRLIVVGIDTIGYTTTVVADNIESAIDAFQNPNGISISLNDGQIRSLNTIERFVINMSFAIIPCNKVHIDDNAYNSLLANDNALGNLEEDLRNLLSTSGLSDEEQARVVKSTILMGSSYRDTSTDTEGTQFIKPKEKVFGGDPLYGLLIEQESNPNVVLVAAAGNLGQYFEFPFAPAIWDFVISVSSEGENSGSVVDTAHCLHMEIIDYSNCGEIKMNGDSYSNVGTSYAAPKFSYNVALYLIDDNFSQCTGTNNTGSSVFGYADESRPWLNFGFDAAFNDFCILGTPTP